MVYNLKYLQVFCLYYNNINANISLVVGRSWPSIYYVEFPHNSSVKKRTGSIRTTSSHVLCSNSLQYKRLHTANRYRCSTYLYRGMYVQGSRLRWRHISTLSDFHGGEWMGSADRPHNWHGVVYGSTDLHLYEFVT